METATAAQPSIARRYAILGTTRTPVARDYGLFGVLTLLGALGLLFWSAVVVALVALL